MSLPRLDIETLKQLPKMVASYRKPNFTKAGKEFFLTLFLFIVSMIAGYTVTIRWYYYITPLFVISSCLLLLRLFVIQHDCSHQAYTKSPLINNIYGQICSLFTFMPYEYRGKTHAFHHNHVNKLWEYRDIGDVDTLTVEEFQALSRWGKFKYRLFRNPFLLFSIVPTWYLFIHDRLPLDFVKGWHKEYSSLIINNISIAMLYTAIILFLGYKVVLLFQLPVLVLFACIAFRFFYIQHQYEFNYKAVHDQREYVRGAIEGSSFYDLPRFWHRVTFNIGYHHIHHLNASIPCYELANCFKENKILQDVARRLTFKQSLSCVWSHLWDDYQGKMISFREYYRRYSQ